MNPSPSRLIAADIGNTSITIGIFAGRRLLRRRAIPVSALNAVSIRKILGGRDRNAPVFVSSVAPKTTARLRTLLRGQKMGPFFVLGGRIKPPVRNLARVPGEVGIDRLVNAVAVHRLYGKDAIVVDFGTAITFDVVSGRGAYLGGVIAPGIELTLNALFEKTALLPKVRLKPPARILGRSTEECIRSGCSFGLGALCDGLIAGLRLERPGTRLVLATGGYAGYMARYSRLIGKIDPALTLKGIQLTAESYLGTQGH